MKKYLLVVENLSLRCIENYECDLTINERKEFLYSIKRFIIQRNKTMVDKLGVDNSISAFNGYYTILNIIEIPINRF